jgi:hypothetical protein
MRLLEGVQWTPSHLKFVAVWLLIYVLTDVIRLGSDAARDWSRQDLLSANSVVDPVNFLGERMRRELIRATDLGGRWTVAALMWSLVYFGTDNILSLSDRAWQLSRLTDNINVALLVGPVLGLVWWVGEWEYRQGLLWADRTLTSGTLGDVEKVHTIRFFLASADPLGNALGAALIAAVVVAV